MEYRDPVVINVSFYYQFETPSAQVDQLTRAADLTALFMEVKHKIDKFAPQSLLPVPAPASRSDASALRLVRLSLLMLSREPPRT
jgi:hypothetical protein